MGRASVAAALVATAAQQYEVALCGCIAICPVDDERRQSTAAGRLFRARQQPCRRLMWRTALHAPAGRNSIRARTANSVKRPQTM